MDGVVVCLMPVILRSVCGDLVGVRPDLKRRRAGWISFREIVIAERICKQSRPDYQ